MQAAALIVIVIAQSSPAQETCGARACADVLAGAFAQAARRVLGGDAKIQTRVASEDPPDEQSANDANGVDGVVELSFATEASKARVHCYLSKEHRWVDREISFGERRGSLLRETLERGRLLGFAVATMLTGDADAETTSDAAPTPEPVPAPPAKLPPASPTIQGPTTVPAEEHPVQPAARPGRRSLEFAGIGSTGLDGTAGGLGASASLRLAWTGPLWARLFIAGRTGSIPKAQTSTRTVLMGGGLAVALLPEPRPVELGVRLDAFASYFDASHLSEDDESADRRSRWQAGGDVIVEGGLQIAGGASALLGIGIEGILGRTDIYTHGTRVAEVSPLRAVAELGFRTRF